MLWGKHILRLFPHWDYSKADQPPYFCQIKRLQENEPRQAVHSTRFSTLKLSIDCTLWYIYHHRTHSVQGSGHQDTEIGKHSYFTFSCLVKWYPGRYGKEHMAHRHLLCTLERLLPATLKGLSCWLPGKADVLRAAEWLLEVNCSTLVLGYLKFN